MLNYVASLVRCNFFSPVPGFEFEAFFVPDMSAGLRAGNLAGYGTAVVQYDLGGADDPVVAFVICVGIREVSRFHLHTVRLPKII